MSDEELQSPADSVDFQFPTVFVMNSGHIYMAYIVGESHNCFTVEALASLRFDPKTNSYSVRQALDMYAQSQMPISSIQIFQDADATTIMDSAYSGFLVYRSLEARETCRDIESDYSKTIEWYIDECEKSFALMSPTMNIRQTSEYMYLKETDPDAAEAFKASILKIKEEAPVKSCTDKGVVVDFRTRHSRIDGSGVTPQ